MEMHLQPLATTCFVSGEAFTDGARVASYLVRSGASLEIVRYDVLEAHTAGFAPEGVLACKWVQLYKPRKAGENTDRTLKLTAESLFVALADPTTEPTPENTRLVQFLALMLERKKILRPRGLSADGLRNRYEHAKSKAIFEVPAGELTPEFFVAVQAQLSVLVGAPKTKPDAAPGATPAATPGSPTAASGVSVSGPSDAAGNGGASEANDATAGAAESSTTPSTETRDRGSSGPNGTGETTGASSEHIVPEAADIAPATR